MTSSLPTNLRSIPGHTMELLSLSTAHITQKTAHALGARSTGLWENLSFERYGDFGWIMYVSSDECLIDAIKDEYPDIVNVFNLARANGFHWVWFDCDAPIVEGVTTYEW